jgi:tRNA (mo5U34)-methyltransferase
VALDHYVWSLDLPNHIAYWRECKETGVTPLPNEQTPYWQPETLPGRKGFDAAHTALRSTVEPVVGDFMTMDVAALGRFDVVLYLGVLYHMEDPLASLRRLADVTGRMAIIETHAVAIPGFEDLELVEFYSANQLNADVTNWWGPNLTALVGLCRAAGFSRVDVVVGDPVGRTSLTRRLRTAVGDALRAASVLPWRHPSGGRRHFRAVVHAWR